jgi:hypothetical protein
MTISTYTFNLSLGLVNFNSPLWGDDVNRNFNILDAAIASVEGDVRFANAVGTNAITATYTPAITAYTSGLRLWVRLQNAPTGAMTINVNGLGAKNILYRGSVIQAGQLFAGDVISILYDGTQFNILGLINQEFAALNIINGLSGATAPSGANQVVIESDNTTGMSILTPSTKTVNINFGNEVDNDIAGIRYNHATSELLLRADANYIAVDDIIEFSCVGQEYRFTFGGGTMRTHSVAANIIRFGSTLSTTNGLFINLSNGFVGIGKNNPTTALDVNGIVKATGFEGPINLSGVLGVLGIAQGGTGGDNVTQARTNLGLGDLAVKDKVDNTDWNAAGAKLAVSNGGSGVGTLTGYIKGNGTSPYTASPTIPVADIAGLTPFSGDASDIVSGVFSNARMGVNANTNGDGYVLPGGLIIKWGGIFVASDGNSAVTFAIPFPNAIFNVVITPVSASVGGGDSRYAPAVWNKSASGFTIYNDGTLGVSMEWIAIGY